MIYIFGAGITGLTLARLLADKQQVVVFETRNHIGGNCYDYYDKNGVLIHKYGPHLFHTDNKKVYDFLSEFTEWIPYQHKVLASIDNFLIPIPFNFKSLDIIFPKHSKTYQKKLLELFPNQDKISLDQIKILPEIYDFVYNKIFLNYTIKQWGCSPDKISKEVINRIPIVLSYNDNYFQDKYQVLPKFGYTKMFYKMIDHKNISVKLNSSINPFEVSGTVVYTGKIDQLFNYKFGKLRYRSINFKFDYFNSEQQQITTTINYPNEKHFTRITEIKHATKQKCSGTTLCTEYPVEYNGSNEPYYPMFDDSNFRLYQNYKNLLSEHKNIICAGRLAEYKYYDMDDAVANALVIYERIFL